MNADDEAKFAQRLADLERKFQLETIPKPAETEPALQENRRTRYQEAGEWARHYSTVRMTTTTVLVSLSIGILSFKWDPAAQPPQIFVDFAGLVWTAALFLFVLFTHYTYREMQNAREHRNRLPALQGETAFKKQFHPRQDVASWLLLGLTLIYAIFLLDLCAAYPVWHWRFFSRSYSVPPTTVPWAMIISAVLGIGATMWPRIAKR
jgi:hypothetical protein